MIILLFNTDRFNDESIVVLFNGVNPDTFNDETNVVLFIAIIVLMLIVLFAII